MINISHELPKCISFTLISDKTNKYGNVGGGKIKPSAEKSKQFIVSCARIIIILLISFLFPHLMIHRLPIYTLFNAFMWGSAYQVKIFYLS